MGRGGHRIGFDITVDVWTACWVRKGVHCREVAIGIRSLVTNEPGRLIFTLLFFFVLTSSRRRCYGSPGRRPQWITGKPFL